MRSEFKKRLATFHKKADPNDYIGELVLGQYELARDFEHFRELMTDKIEKLRTLLRMQDVTNRDEIDQHFIKESIELMEDYLKSADEDDFKEAKADASNSYNVKDIDFGGWNIPGLERGTFQPGEV